MAKKILLLEDEPSIREFISVNLRKGGYDPIEAATGEDAIKLYYQYKDEIDVALLDISLPGIDGFEVCTTLRGYNSNIGIIMLTARAQEYDKVRGLTLGADDYVTKPFSIVELSARIEAVYRRIQLLENAAIEKKAISENLEIVSAEYILHLRKRTFTKNGELIDITQLESQVLEYLMLNPNKMLTRTEILERVWGRAYIGEEKVVDVNIRRIRLKIEENPGEPKNIVTIWGMGYKWTTE